MTPFAFTYHQRDCMGNFIHSEKGYGWIKVYFFEHSAIILRSGIQTKDNRMIWVQNVQHGEPVWPHELIQAMGEGIESNGVLL
jgi:hypothetical protein